MNKRKSVFWSSLVTLILLVFTTGRIQNRALAQGGQYSSYSPLVINFSAPLPSNYITVVDISPPSPAQLDLQDSVIVSFDYTTDEADGVRIWAVPYTNGEDSPGCGYCQRPPKNPQ